VLATLAAALCAAPPFPAGGTIWSVAPPWVAALPIPPAEQARDLPLGQELFNVEVTPEQPAWFRFVPGGNGPVLVRYATLEGGHPSLLVLDALGFPVGGLPESPFPRTMAAVPCRPGVPYYLAVLGLGERVVGNVLVADAAALAKDPPTGSVANDGSADFSVQLGSLDPCCIRLPLQPGQPAHVSIDFGGGFADALITGPGGEVLLHRPMGTASAPIEADVAPVSAGPYVLTLLRLPISSEPMGVHVAVKPPAAGPALVLTPEQALTCRLERHGDTGTAVALLQSGRWRVILSGGDWFDYMRLLVRLSGEPPPGLLIQKGGGAPPAEGSITLIRPCTASLTVEYTSGPGRVACEVRLERQDESLPGGPPAPPGGELAPGWSGLQLRAGAVYAVRFPTGNRPFSALRLLEPETGEWRGLETLPQAGSDLILRPLEDGVLNVFRSPGDRERVAVSEVPAPASDGLPRDPTHAVPLQPGAPPMTLTLTPACPQAWLRLEATAGTRYELWSGNEVGCDTDVTVLPPEGADAVWSDGEEPESPGLRGTLRLTWTCPKSGPYLIRVAPHAPLSSSLGYVAVAAQIAAEGLPVPQPCTLAPSTHEAPVVPTGTPLCGSIAPWHAGYLRVTLPAGRALSLDANQTHFVHAGIRFVDEAGDPAGEDEFAKSQPQYVLPLVAAADMQVFVEMVNWCNYTGYFELCLQAGDAAQS
jgi:hypothetical protein